MGRLLFFQVHGLLARGEDKLVGLGNVNLLEVKWRCSGVCRPWSEQDVEASHKCRHVAGAGAGHEAGG
jgi:hypothetical protein